VAALAVLYVANKSLAKACAAASIKFPSPLIGNMRACPGTCFSIKFTARFCSQFRRCCSLCRFKLRSHSTHQAVHNPFV
jgi:hypothetical protein